MLIRPLQESDDAEIRRLFLDTIALGGPTPFPLSRADEYAHVCLGWYLTEGRASATVAVDDHGRVVGYALVCVDPTRHARWSSRATAVFVIATAWAAITGRLSPSSRHFYSKRARDSLGLWRGRRTAPMPAHAHVNLRRDARFSGAARRLCGHVDDVVRAVGAPGWCGEVNSEQGQREGPLRRLGLDTLDRRPNHTLTWLVGRPVIRLTVVRRPGSEILCSARQ